MKLSSLKRVPLEIAQSLAENKKIVNLIYNDSPTVLTDKDVEISMQKLIEDDYIGFYPATESGINDIDRNTFIIINLEDFSFQQRDFNTGVNGVIYITTNKARSLLDKNRLRILELADEIEGTLENCKLSAAGKITILSMHYVVFSDFRCGYRINFRLNDQQSRRAEL